MVFVQGFIYMAMWRARLNEKWSQKRADLSSEWPLIIVSTVSVMNRIQCIVLFCSCRCFWLLLFFFFFFFSNCYGPFNSVSSHKFSRQLSAFSLCSSGLISTLLVLSTIYLSMEVSFSPEIILCG